MYQYYIDMIIIGYLSLGTAAAAAYLKVMLSRINRGRQIVILDWITLNSAHLI